MDIPAQGASLELVEQAARYLKIEIPQNGVATALKVQREALEAITLVAAKLYSEADEISDPPPGYPLNDRLRFGKKKQKSAGRIRGSR